MIRAHSLHQRTLDLGIAPASDSGFDVRRDVRRGSDESRGREYHAAGKRLLGNRLAVGIARGVAVTAGHDGVDEIAAPLGRRFSHGAAGNYRQHDARDADTKHDSPLALSKLYCTGIRCRKIVRFGVRSRDRVKLWQPLG